MANPRFPAVCPLGKLTVTAAGTTVPLSTNCGPLAGGVGGTVNSPATAGTSLRQVVLYPDKANTGQVFVLPKGYRASANPALIIAVVAPGIPVTLPPSGSQLGMLPENFVLDTDTASQVVYGCGFFF